MRQKAHPAFPLIGRRATLGRFGLSVMVMVILMIAMRHTVMMVGMLTMHGAIFDLVTHCAMSLLAGRAFFIRAVTAHHLSMTFVLARCRCGVIAGGGWHSQCGQNGKSQIFHFEFS